jgi:hypothetical protein
MLSYSALKREKEKEYSRRTPKKIVREYKPVWDRIKTEGKCVISCAPDNRAKVKKGVIKEKDMDEEFKILGFTRLEVIENEQGLIFKLHDHRPLSVLGVL